jgi:hypothetical protein
VELVLNLRQLERLGISGRFQYALAKTYFYGPITGGFAGDEPLAPGLGFAEGDSGYRLFAPAG